MLGRRNYRDPYVPYVGISIQNSPPTASVLLRNYPELPGTPWNYLLLKPGTTLHVEPESLILVAKVDEDVDREVPGGGVWAGTDVARTTGTTRMIENALVRCRG